MSEKPSPFSVFVTGTDTGVGKTWVSLALMAYWQAAGWRTAGMKPVASGCRRVGGRLENEDAALLRAQADEPPPYDVVNPYAYEPAIAPHLAAADRQERISLDTISRNYARLRESVDLVVVEGVGGWLVPLNERETVADLALYLDLPVLLVVGIRLGCLNHAMLTAESIRAHGARLVGWVGSFPEPEPDRALDNITTLEKRLPAPCLGVLPRQAGAQPEKLARCLTLSPAAVRGDAQPTSHQP